MTNSLKALVEEISLYSVTDQLQVFDQQDTRARTSACDEKILDMMSSSSLDVMASDEEMGTAKSPQQPFKFLNLPPELQLEVMDHLPAKRIQRLTRVNRQLRGLVQSNPSRLSNPNKEIQRINDFHRYHINMDWDVDLLEALRRIVSVRGMDESPKTLESRRAPYAHSHIIAMLDSLWTGPSLESLENDGAETNNLYIELRKVAKSLLHLYVSWRGAKEVRPVPIMGPWSRKTWVKGVYSRSQEDLSVFGIDQDALREWYDKIIQTPEGYFRGPSKDLAVGVGILHCPLAGVYYHSDIKPVRSTGQVDCYLNLAAPGGSPSMKGVSDLLGVPSIFQVNENSNWLGESEAGLFAYCVESRWAAERVFQAINEGPKLTSMERLAILEELFVR